jgi:DNA repair protein RadC
MLPYPFKAFDTAGHYKLDAPVKSEDIVKMANYLSRQFLKKGTDLTSPERCFSYLQTILQDREHEVFGVIFLDQQNRVICFEEMFKGTLSQAIVYPREIAKLTLQFNAAAVILFHNHPSGIPTPSQSDISLTHKIKQTLSLIEVRTLDHVILGLEGYVSLADIKQM